MGAMVRLNLLIVINLLISIISVQCWIDTVWAFRKPTSL